MKQSVRCLSLAASALILGAVGAFARRVYFQNAVDAGGFLLRGHPAQIFYWVLAGVLILTAFFLSYKGQKEAGEAPSGILAGILQILLGISLFFTAWNLDTAMSFSAALRILGFVAAAGLMADGGLRCAHKSGGMMASGLFCAFLLVYAVGSYSLWRSMPEMERFLTPALGTLSLLPLSCEMAAWDIGRGRSRRLMFFAALTGFFALSALACPGTSFLHMGAAVWSLGILFFLRGNGA